MQLLGRLGALGDRAAGRWPSHVLERGEGDVGLTDEPATVFRGILWLAALGVGLQSLLHLVDAVFFDLRIDRLDADRDQSVWSWTGSSAELMAALGALLLLVLAPRRWKALGFLTLAFTFFSMDDTVRVHEALGNLPFFKATGLSARIVWPLLYAPLMLAVYVVLWRVTGAMAERCRRATISGLVCLGVAVVLEFAASTALVKTGYGRLDHGSRVGSMLYELEVVAEEALELGGWLLIAAAMIATAVELLARRVATRAASVGAGAAAGQTPAGEPERSVRVGSEDLSTDP